MKDLSQMIDHTMYARVFKTSSARSLASLGMTTISSFGRFRTRIADRLDHKIVLLRENCAEIEFEAVVGDVTDERRR